MLKREECKIKDASKSFPRRELNAYNVFINTHTHSNLLYLQQSSIAQNAFTLHYVMEDNLPGKALLKGEHTHSFSLCFTYQTINQQK